MAPFDITFPQRDANSYDQDEEWCSVVVEGEPRAIRFHDYEEIFAIPGLYEQLFYEELECDSPRVLCNLLAEAIADSGDGGEELRVLDVGAGNGMVGEQLAQIGASSIVGVDLIEAAAEAAERDRPGLYDEYLVADLTDLDPDQADRLRDRRFNCLTTVAALGFDDIPPDAFANAHNLVEPGGWIVFNIKDDFISPHDDESGFATLIRGGLADRRLDLASDRVYRHRLSVAREPLDYVAVIARKGGDLPISDPANAPA